MPDLTPEERAEALRLARDPGSSETWAYMHRELVARALLAAEARERELLHLGFSAEHWHGEYIAACKSLKKRVLQGAEAVRRERELREAIAEADEVARQPIDLNYVAIPKDDWERIVSRAALRQEGARE